MQTQMPLLDSFYFESKNAARCPRIAKSLSLRYMILHASCIGIVSPLSDLWNSGYEITISSCIYPHVNQSLLYTFSCCSTTVKVLIHLTITVVYPIMKLTILVQMASHSALMQVISNCILAIVCGLAIQLPITYLFSNSFLNLNLVHVAMPVYAIQ